MSEQEIIEKVKQQTDELWQTIQEAKKYNIRVYVGLDDTFGRVLPEIKISSILFRQD
ncbi:hypothetical protein [Flavobacterium sp. LB1P71]|uniref:hypothetical protein n=1 Tax=unclassified Flavobacterium TaxID=196869 RepID=UPI003AACE5F8